MAKKAVWLFADNFILNSIKGNYTKALKVSKFHFDALTEKQADPGIAPMLTEFTPVHTALENSESGKGMALGQRAGKTQSVNDLLKELVETKLPAWQQQIRNTYGAKTAEYKALFPQGNAPFETGKKDNRILAVKTLRDACTADPALAAVAALIAAFYILLDKARNQQLGKKTDVGGDIETEKDAITAMAKIHFKNHGKLIGLYPDDPDRIASFSDVTTLQSHVHDSIYKGTDNPGKTKKVLTHTFTAASTVTISNTSLADQKFWLTDRSNNPIHPNGITVGAGQIVTTAVQTLGNPVHRILMVENLNVATPGSYEVSINDQ